MNVEWSRDDRDGMAHRPKYLLSGPLQKKNVLILVLGEELNPTVISSGGEQTSIGETHRLRDLF